MAREIMTREEMNRELKRLALRVTNDLYDLYRKRNWNCNFETFKSCFQEKLADECKRWWIEGE